MGIRHPLPLAQGVVGGFAGTAGAPPSQDEGTYLSEIKGQVYSVHDSIQLSVSFQAFRSDQAPRSVHVSSMPLEEVISPPKADKLKKLCDILVKRVTKLETKQ